MSRAMPGAGPWGEVHRRLHRWLRLPHGPLPAQQQLPASKSVSLPAARAALCPRSSGPAGLLWQLVGIRAGEHGGGEAPGFRGGQAWTPIPAAGGSQHASIMK